jgi:hypothetical protein
MEKSMRIKSIGKAIWWSLIVAFVVVVLIHISMPEGFIYMRQSQEADLKPITEFRNDTERLQVEIKRLEGELQAIEFVLTKSQQEDKFRTFVQQSYIKKRGRMEELKAMRDFAVNTLKR